MGVVASAPAKIILFGEHFVVYGEPAIVIAIDRRASVKIQNRDDGKLRFHSTTLKYAGHFEKDVFKIEQGDEREARIKFEPVKHAVESVLEKRGERVGLDIEIDSSIPIGAGLGSSAAVVAASTAAAGALLNVKLSKEDIFRITLETERIVHGNPSGIDPAVSAFGGAILFQMDTGFKPLDANVDAPLVVGDTGVERSTRVQVEKFRLTLEKYPRIIENMMRAEREVVLRAVDAFKENDLETLGNLMNINQSLLCGVGVSDESLDRLANAARKAGALGAKMTGAGGGGCIIALSREEKLQSVLEAIQTAGGRSFMARKTDEGVRIDRR
jgi:mevalonate kinase